MSDIDIPKRRGRRPNSITEEAESQAIGWMELTQKLMKLHSHGHQIACVWHPEALGDLIHTEHLGNIRVVNGGPVRYQLSTGEVVQVKAESTLDQQNNILASYIASLREGQ